MGQCSCKGAFETVRRTNGIACRFCDARHTSRRISRPRLWSNGSSALLWTEQEPTVVVSWSRRFNNFHVSAGRLVRVEPGLGRAGGPMISSYFSTSTHYMP